MQIILSRWIKHHPNNHMHSKKLSADLTSADSFFGCYYIKRAISLHRHLHHDIFFPYPHKHLCAFREGGDNNIRA